MKSKFIEGGTKNKLPMEKLEKIWIDWEAFAQYAFNKSHSTCYAYLAFQTAYLKANYPAEYMASVLTHNMNDITKISFFMDECRRMGLKVLGPDINESIATFSVNKNGQVRFGMAAIKGVGEKAVDNIVKERSENGFYKSVFDLAKRTDLKALNKRVLEGLASAGAFDSFEGVNRAMFFTPGADGNTLTEKIAKFGSSSQTGSDSSQGSLFGEAEEEIEIAEPTLPNVEPFGVLDQLKREKEVVGVYISGHPLDTWRLEMDHIKPFSLAELKANLTSHNGKDLTLAGVVTTVQHRTSKAGKPFGLFAMEDYHGAYEFFLFGDDYVKFRNYMGEDFSLLIKGRVQNRYGQPDNFEFKIVSIQLLSELKEKTFKSVKLKIEVDNLNEELLNKVDALVKTYSNGKCNLQVVIEDKKENVSLNMFSKSIKVSLDTEFLDELKRMSNVELELG
ncbi:MAG: hypothetical protein IAF38_15915 [Bacteroidia bacterium]|nr:hypothetical protein [Bacteroidia bacterium]